MDQTQRRAIVFGMLAAAIWGGMYVVSKAVLVFIPPFALLSLRLLLGAAALGVVLWRTGRWPQLSRSQWVQSCWLARWATGHPSACSSRHAPIHRGQWGRDHDRHAGLCVPVCLLYPR